MVLSTCSRIVFLNHPRWLGNSGSWWPYSFKGPRMRNTAWEEGTWWRVSRAQYNLSISPALQPRIYCKSSWTQSALCHWIIRICVLSVNKDTWFLTHVLSLASSFAWGWMIPETYACFIGLHFIQTRPLKTHTFENTRERYTFVCPTLLWIIILKKHLQITFQHHRNTFSTL